MLLITLRDMQWRARRVLLGVAATAVVFAMTLLLGAIHQAFLDESVRTVDLVDADAWLVDAGVAGPFTSNSPVPVALGDPLAAAGAEVVPVAIVRQVVEGVGDGFVDVNLMGVRPGDLDLDLTDGRASRGSGELVADESLGAGVGDTLTLAGRTMTVVGTVHGLTYYGGAPGVVLDLAAVQHMAFDGAELATTLVVRGDTDVTAPDGLRAMGDDAVVSDLERPLSTAIGTVGILSVLLWIVAAGIVGFTSYLSGLDRLRDFAVFKAVGVTDRVLAVGLVLQAVLVSVLAAVVAIGLALVFAPVFPMQIAVGAPDALRLIGIAAVIGAVASLTSVQRLRRIDPALAFG
ncbi:ABC transporter permease [Nocardioides zeae]|uniref:ABC transporter permease n=1 Tax=Nocardioides zeae TaxID=1457234 RepID=A0A6P0HKV2_9ACTN|nr:ABC transporter permease [Nocardioides zeae]NEN79216.1 ABC transporter permease [Nocardioides zeae]